MYSVTSNDARGSGQDHIAIILIKVVFLKYIFFIAKNFATNLKTDFFIILKFYVYSVINLQFDSIYGA